MRLWYVNIWLNPETGFSDDYRYEFTLSTRFISNWFSREMRNTKNRFATDGSFNMISVNPTPLEITESKIRPESALVVSVPFDQDKYESSKGTSDCEYYLKLLEEGFRKAADFKDVPLETLLGLIDTFRGNGYENEWVHKKRRFKEFDIEVVLSCHFTTLDFKLIASVRQLSTKTELCSGIIIRSEPDEIVFEKQYKDILIEDEKIVVTDAITDSPRVVIDLQDASNNKFSFEIVGDKQTAERLSYSDH